MSDREATKEIPAKAFLRLAAGVAAPLGVLAFWGGMIMAARHYPSEYDWRYMTLSSLLSPARNPAAHLWASGGIVLCGLCGLGWTAAWSRCWNREGAGVRPGGIRTLRWGNVCMIGSSVLPDWLLPVRKGHEILALLAFAGLCLGMIQLTFQTMEKIFQRWARTSSGCPRWHAAALAGAAAVPIVLAGLAQAYVFYVLPKLHWVDLSWRARGVPVYFSFAFWEWITCVELSAYWVAGSLTNYLIFSNPKFRAGV
jgi:hypothetical protein